MQVSSVSSKTSFGILDLIEVRFGQGKFVRTEYEASRLCRFDSFSKAGCMVMGMEMMVMDYSLTLISRTLPTLLRRIFS